MNDKKSKIIIEGITESGEQFRPSDWAERMSGSLSTFHKPLQPSSKDGHRCVLLDPKLKESNPELYQSILDFASTNQLKICREEDNEENS